MNERKSAKVIEEVNRERFEEDYYISRSYISRASINQSLSEADYFKRLERIRLDLIKKYGHDKNVLDLCCATGDYLIKSQYVIREGIGIDLSEKMINEAVSRKNRMNITNIEFIICNAKQIPYKKDAFGLVFSFSSLYYMPEIEKIVLEVARSLKSGSGIAILEFGNLYSLNTVVCKAYPEWAIPCHIKVKDMKRIIKNAGLEIIEWKAFQILPLWGSRPMRLKPLLHPLWKSLLQREVKGRMVDEWISNLPVVKNFAFRHVFVCEKLLLETVLNTRKSRIT